MKITIRLPKDPIPPRLSASYEEAQAGPRPDAPDFGEAPETASAGNNRSDSATTKAAAQAAPNTPVVRPFDQLPELPENIAQAFETFKLAILHHKGNNWKDISPGKPVGRPGGPQDPRFSHPPVTSYPAE